MRLNIFYTLVAFVCAAPLAMLAQTPPTEGSRAVAGAGISAAGWTGKVDSNEEKSGKTIQDDKLSESGGVLSVTTGPAANFWKSGDTASGNYTVTATFNEAKYMNLNSHPHPYGIFIGGSEMGTPQQKLLYCAAYGNGTFIMRGFGPDAFQMNGRRPEANDSVHKAAGPGEPVSQEIAISVKGDRVECSINGKVVAGYEKSAVIGDGKLKSTDGVYGVRFSHNTEATVSGLSLSKN